MPGLALAAAVSLGITRFAYGLLLPPMRADRQWSCALAGTAFAGRIVGPMVVGWVADAARRYFSRPSALSVS